MPDWDKKFVTLALFFSDGKAVTRFMSFSKFEITEHRTGDTLEVKWFA